MLHTSLADLTMNLGDTAAADEHARAALPVMERLGAMDDVVQLRALLVLCAIAEERLADAAAELERVDAIDDRGTLFGGIAFRQIGAAELALARGEIAVRAAHLPGVRGGPGGAAAAGDRADRHGAVGHARRIDRARGACLPRGDRRRRRLRPRACSPTSRERLLRVLDPANPHLDYPVAGLALFALGAWGLLRDAAPVGRRGRAARPRRALRLQPDDPDDGVGADRAARRGARPRPDRRAARRASATGGRRSCSTRRTASSSGSPARGAACSCAPRAARRSPSRRCRRAASSRPRR